MVRLQQIGTINGAPVYVKATKPRARLTPALVWRTLEACDWRLGATLEALGWTETLFYKELDVLGIRDEYRRRRKEQAPKFARRRSKRG